MHVLLLIQGLVHLIDVFASIVAWRLIETHLLWNILRIFHATPALAEHSHSILLPVNFAHLIRFLNRHRDTGRHSDSPSIRTEFNSFLCVERIPESQRQL